MMARSTLAMGETRVLGTCIDPDEVYDLLKVQSQSCLLMMVDSIAADHGEQLVQRLRRLNTPHVVLLLVDDLRWIRSKHYPLDSVDAVIHTHSFGKGVLIDGLTLLRRGEMFVDPAIKAALQRSTRPDAVQLTNRELDTLRELADGLTNRQIGARLGVAETTVRDYVKTLMMKLEATNRTQVVRRALDAGLLDYTGGRSSVA
jgi:DNA-binding NarL/FixJ family response regulator